MRQSDQGPIYLGYRLGHIRGDSRVFRALVYNKGAAVLHMLRRLVGDEAFFRGLRRFYASSRFQKAGTDDFRAAMEAETGRPLERFFERWIYGSTLPRLKFSYRGSRRPTEDNASCCTSSRLGEVFDRAADRHAAVRRQTRSGRRRRARHRARGGRLRVALDGPLRGVDVSRDDGTLAEIVKELELEKSGWHRPIVRGSPARSPFPAGISTTPGTAPSS